MTNRFRIIALQKALFTHYVTMSDDQLIALNARRLIAENKPGYPCRVSLKDAEEGEKIIALPYEHHARSSPYRASGPIFVREKAETAVLAENHIPHFLLGRLLSVRTYSAAGMMLNAKVVEGNRLREISNRIMDDREVSYFHLHNARPGCFLCQAVRP